MGTGDSASGLENSRADACSRPGGYRCWKLPCRFFLLFKAQPIRMFGGEPWTRFQAAACAARFGSSPQGSRAASGSAIASTAGNITGHCFMPRRSSCTVPLPSRVRCATFRAGSSAPIAARRIPLPVVHPSNAQLVASPPSLVSSSFVRGLETSR